MILPLVIAVWIFVLSLVAGLCAAARVGEVDRTGADGWERPNAPTRERPAQLERTGTASIRFGGSVEAGPSLARSGGWAA